MTDKELHERAIEAAYDAGRNRDGTPPDEWTLGKAIDVVDAYLAIAPQAPVNGAPVAFRWRGIGEWFFGTRAPDGVNAEALYLASPPPPAQADDGKDAEIERLKMEKYNDPFRSVGVLWENKQKQDALIRELVAALVKAERVINRDTPPKVRIDNVWVEVRAVIAKAKAAGYEP